jgi:hypothetical protein
MPRIMLIHITCDMCGVEVDEKDVTTGTVIVDHKRYQLDLCPEHASFIAGLTPQSAALADVKPKVRHGAQTPKAERTLPCPVPGCKTLVKNERGLSFHIQKMHPGYKN